MLTLIGEELTKISQWDIHLISISKTLACYIMMSKLCTVEKTRSNECLSLIRELTIPDTDSH